VTKTTFLASQWWQHYNCKMSRNTLIIVPKEITVD